MATRGTMNISLTPRLRRFVTRRVESGRYTSASEVIREALMLLEQTEEQRKKDLDEVRKRIALGLQQLDRGESVDGEKVFREIQLRSRQRRRTQAG